MAKFEVFRYTGKPAKTRHNGKWNVNPGDIIETYFQGIYKGIEAAGDQCIINEENNRPHPILPKEKYSVIFGYGRRYDTNPKHWLQNWRHTILEQQRKNNGYVFCWDGGFFKSLGNFKYFRFALNSPLRNGVFLNENSPDDRWNMMREEFNIPYKDQFNNGKNILICTQPDEGFSMNNTRTVSLLKTWVPQIKQQTNKPIVIKPHPNTKGKEMDDMEHFCKKTGVSMIEPQIQLYDYLKDTYAMITYNSTVAVESVAYGIRTFTMDDMCHAWSVSDHDLSLLNTPTKYDRNQWLNDICYMMWSADEMASGEILKRFKRYINEND